MTSRKNVIFIGMTQNGKSSLIQQILRYAGAEELSRTVGIGQGNFSQTQTCSVYNVDVPLKKHFLRQIEGPDETEERNGSYVVPGEDFDIDDADDFKFGQDVRDSGDRLHLTLIDTPGLSDSGNSRSSTSGMRVVDERHKLRILLSLQNIEHVHAICFVVSRETNFGGDFQDLVRRMVELLSYCVRSTAWNLQYHIIHTRIDVNDRSAGVCERRSRTFDEFGPGGAEHHFVDNTPDKDSPLDDYFANHSLSFLVQSLSKGSGVNFTNLHYPKSREQECNDQNLKSAARQAISALSTDVETREKQIAGLKRDAKRHRENAWLNKVRVDDYDKKISDLDCDTPVEIDSEEGWTGSNYGGGGAMRFTFVTTVPILKVEKSHDGDGDWENETTLTPTSKYYSITLQPHWFYKAHGKVKLFGTKRNVQQAEIAALRAQMAPIKARWESNLRQAEKTELEITDLLEQNMSTRKVWEALTMDVDKVRQSGHSIPLASSQKLVKYFTVDSPLAAAIAYGLVTKVPWTVAPLSKLSRPEFSIRIQHLLLEAKVKIEEREAMYKTISLHLGLTQGLKAIMPRLTSPPVTAAAKLAAGIITLRTWHRAAIRMGLSPSSFEMGEVTMERITSGLEGLIQKLEGFVECRKKQVNPASVEEEKGILKEIEKFTGDIHVYENALVSGCDVGFRDLQRAIWEEEATQLALGLIDDEDGLPIGAYASLIRGVSRDLEDPYLAVLAELKDVGELGELALDD